MSGQPVFVTGGTGYLGRPLIEALLAATGIAATILRPWHVLGPGHRWPIVLAPLYALLRMIPATRESAQRLGLVTREQVIASLVHAVANPPSGGLRLVEVPEMKRASS